MSSVLIIFWGHNCCNSVEHGLFKKLVVAHLVSKFPALYGTRTFITVLIDKNPPLNVLLRQMNPVRIHTSYFFATRFNSNLPPTLISSKSCLSFRFSDIYLYAFLISHVYGRCPAHNHPSLFGHLYNVLRTVQSMKLHVMHISPSNNFLSLSLIQIFFSVLSCHTSSICGLPFGWETKFHTHINNRQNDSSFYFNFSFRVWDRVRQ
jgi:hypothetical protein